MKGAGPYRHRSETFIPTTLEICMQPEIDPTMEQLSLVLPNVLVRRMTIDDRESCEQRNICADPHNDQARRHFNRHKALGRAKLHTDGIGPIG